MGRLIIQIKEFVGQIYMMKKNFEEILKNAKNEPIKMWENQSIFRPSYEIRPKKHATCEITQLDSYENKPYLQN